MRGRLCSGVVLLALTWCGTGASTSAEVTLDIEPAVFFEERLDTNPNWPAEGGWEFGTPLGECQDPSAGRTGDHVFGYNLAGCYADDEAEYFLTIPAIDCAHQSGVRLRFWRWLRVESATFDHARVRVSNDGVTWTDVWEHSGTDIRDTSWAEYEYDISAVADGQPAVYVQWGMGPTDEAEALGGWNIDDVALLGNTVDDLQVVPGNGLEAAGTQEGPFSPDAVAYTLSNRGEGPFDWSASKTQDWVDVTPGSGALSPGQEAVVQVSLNEAANSLLPGVYQDTVSIANETSGVVQTRGVRLEVAPWHGEAELAVNTPLCVVLEPDGLDTLPGALTLTNVGHAELTWSVSVRRPPTANGDKHGPDILVYADDNTHNAPATFIDVALQTLGLGYQAHYDADFDDFVAALSGGTWDLVIFGQESWGFEGTFVFDALLDYLDGGGALVMSSWQMSMAATHDLWAAMGVTFRADDTRPPDPVYWWDVSHELFNVPELVPEFTSLTQGVYSVYGQHLDVAGNGVAVAGYTQSPGEPGQAALVLANDGRSVFRGFTDGANNADLDSDARPDAVELWVNTVTWILAGARWLSVSPDSGVLMPSESVVLDVTFDAAGLEDGFAGTALLEIRGNDTTPPPPIETTLFVSEDDLLVIPLAPFEASGLQEGPFFPESAAYTLWNAGPSPVAWSASNTAAWAGLAPDPAEGTLGADQSTEVTVSVGAAAAGLAPGLYEGELGFANETSGYTRTLSMTLEVLPRPGEITVTDSVLPANDLAIPFGTLTVGETRTEQIVIANAHGTYGVIISDVVLEGMYSEDFETGCAVSSVYELLGVPALPYTMAPGEALTLSVSYAPVAEQMDETAVAIVSNDEDEPEISVHLTGEGYIPVYIAHTPLGVTTDLGPYAVDAAISAPGGLARAELKWRNDEEAPFAALAMTDLGEGAFTAEIPAQSIGAYVCYYIECENAVGEVMTAPPGAPGNVYCFEVQGIPSLHIAPAALSFVLAPDEAATEQVVLWNTGTWPVEWRMTEIGTGGEGRRKRTAYTPSRARAYPVNWDAPHDDDTLIVGFRAWLGAPARSSAHSDVAVKAPGTQVARSFSLIPADVVRVGRGADLRDVAAAYEQHRDVAYAEPNYRVHADALPNDPRFGELWGLRNEGQSGGMPGADISAPEAWDVTTGSRDVIVAVIDSGVDYGHEDLAANMWTNDPELNGVTGEDDDGNGIVDDIHGAQWVDGTGVARNGSPMDEIGHGTHCAGTIGAVGNNGVGVTGVNWQVRIMALKFIVGDGGLTADAIAALEYAVEHGARVTNNSWGGYGAPEQSLQDAIDAAGDAGLLFVAAAGNDGLDCDVNPHYPASFDSPVIVSVANSDANDARSATSNHGATAVDLAAPGAEILSTAPGNEYASYSGTSMAAPHVAGVAALLLSPMPDADPLALKEWILDSVDVLPEWSGLTVTGGRLNAAEAVALAGVSWLSESPESGVLDAGDSVTVDVMASAAGLVNGSTGSAWLRATGDPDGPLMVDVGLVVTEEDFVVTPPDALMAYGPEGGPFAPSERTYTLMNVGSAAIVWDAYRAADWLDALEPSEGELSPGGTVDVRMALNATADTMLHGLYTASVVFDDTANGVQFDREVTLDIEAPPPTPIFFEPLNADPGWSTEGAWAFGAPQGACGDPGRAHTGGCVYGYNLAGCYAAGMGEQFLTASPINCSRYADIVLRFRRWLQVEQSPLDNARVQAGNDGENWIDVWSNTTGLSDDSWVLREYDISSAADRQPAVYVRWGMGPTDPEPVTTYGGWNIDDVQLVGVLAADLGIVPHAGLDASGPEGGPFMPGSRTYTLWNTSGAALEWTASNAHGWLAVTPASGTLQAGASTPIEAAIEADDLAPGLYTDTVTFTNVTAGTVQVRPVALEVIMQPGDIAVTDSILPDDDRAMPFGLVLVGEEATETITITNADPRHGLTLSAVTLGDTYSEDFDDGLAQGWEPNTPARWEVVEGEYRAMAGSLDKGMQSTYASANWSDLSVRATLRRTGNEYAVAALFARTSEDFDWWYGQHGQGYGLGIDATGRYWLIKWVDGVGSYLQPWTASPFLNEGAEANEVLLSFAGYFIQVYFNGNLVWSCHDSDVSGPGRIGLGGYSGWESEATHFFDNVTAGQPVADKEPVTGAQAWYNAHPANDGTLVQSPLDWQPPACAEDARASAPKLSAKRKKSGNHILPSPSRS